MNVRLSVARFGSIALIASSLSISGSSRAATTNVDLDGNAANGAESQCDLNVVQVFPVKIENKVINKATGDAYTFSWPSAGPGGFTSSVTPGTTGGVGAKWTWTTNQTVYSYTGSTCDKDICFTKTEGPDSIPSFCSFACLADGTTVNIAKGVTAGNVVLSWVGGQGTFTIYRSTSKVGIVDPLNAIGTTDTLSFTDTPPADVTVYYVVRGVDCNMRKACATNADCSAPGDGTCVSRGPFGVPGRSLFSTDVTVSAASLTSSLITFFSPPKEVFRVTDTGFNGGVLETLSSFAPIPFTVTTEAYPLGCCPADPDHPHQLRCGDTCVDYLEDPANCGACGNVCGEGTCCTNGNCVSLCSEGQTWCDGACVALQDDSANCGACGNVCGEGTCCNGGDCVSLCPAGQVWCNEQCVDLDNDSENCGNCGNPCGDGTCCNGGSCVSVCPAGQVWCNEQCVDLQNDSANCGACGTACDSGTCCNDGSCESFCPAGQVLCGEQCADLQNDNANCGACGHACGEGTCCNAGSCVSVCPAGQVWCDNQCVDPQNDSANCGACGQACGSGTCCNGGSCESFCPAGQVLCGTQCVDFQNDNANCGACGNSCGDGTCCYAGSCASLCPAGQVWCNDKCVDLRNDSDNCGSCGHSCGDGTCCNAGACVSECPSGRTFCDGYCVDLQNDPRNCGSCGHVCGHSDFNDDNECENGHCEHHDLVDPLHDPPPIPASCPNPTPTHPVPGYCPNTTPTHPTTGYCHNTNPTNPIPGSCPNATPTDPTPGYCHNTTPTHPVSGSCPNTTPSSPAPGYCPNAHPSPGPVSGVCPDPGPDPPEVAETPTCIVPELTQTIPPGGTVTNCRQGGVLFKEVATAVTVCGDGIPGVSGECNNTTTKVTIGTFNRLVPDVSKSVGDAYVTPFAVHVLSDTGSDGQLGPGDTGDLVIDLVNAGPWNITQASATLSAPAVDLTDDGVDNPVGLIVQNAYATYGTILGTTPGANCTAPPPQPASNATVFTLKVPSNHWGDISHPVVLAVTGTVNGAPFSMNVPISIGIADKCYAPANTRDYDGLDGLSSPMARLVPAGDPVPFPSKSFSAGNTRPLKLRVSCGGVNLTDATVDAPEIIALSEATRGPLDIEALNLNSDNTNNPNDPFFRFNNALSGGQWFYSMRTSLIGTGTFTLTIRIAGRKEYVTGFVLE